MLIKMHLYLEFEIEIFKIVKIVAVLIAFLNARASRARTCILMANGVRFLRLDFKLFKLIMTFFIIT